MDDLGPHNAIWIDDEWISWEEFGDAEDHSFSRLAELERDADLRQRFPKADIALVPFFLDMLSLARDYFEATGQHLNLYGDIGELYGAVAYGIRLHKRYAMGSDGRLGKDFVEIKTLVPHNTRQSCTVRLDRHFNKLLIVRISETFEVSGRLVDRSALVPRKHTRVTVPWADVADAPQGA
ncbi:hypothetical protein [Tropicimonas sp. S265A]|uniref:hypothetical protein n=1 Tax=Tropicimonas sp. S265A TaxID=3415134 RepID=UPI003C7CD34F